MRVDVHEVFHQTVLCSGGDQASLDPRSLCHTESRRPDSRKDVGHATLFCAYRDNEAGELDSCVLGQFFERDATRIRDDRRESTPANHLLVMAPAWHVLCGCVVCKRTYVMSSLLLPLEKASMAEWFKAFDSSSNLARGVGSNPTRCIFPERFVSKKF